MSSTPTAQLSALGVSIWLDDLSRDRITSGALASLIENRDVVGVTTNPTIFAAALATGTTYDAQVRDLAAAGVDVTDAVFEITTDDVASACDIFAPIYASTAGQDGRVSIEVEPGLAHDAAGTIEQARQLWAKVDRPNAMIKIPATREGLEAITETIGAGISVNVTLDLATIHSVASFFVSRVDTEIDKRLTAIGTPEALALKSKAGIANARLAYELFEQEFASARAQELIGAGANVQRPLWASTGVKDPALPDTLYVTELAVGSTVNTMPEKTLEATFDHGVITGDAVSGSYDGAREVLASLEGLGISIAEVTALLEKEGVEKFIVSWNELLDTVTAALEAAR